jgi:hypothetical protein
MPGTRHFPTQEKPALVNAIVLDFLTSDPVLTIAAIPTRAGRSDRLSLPRPRRARP